MSDDWVERYHREKQVEQDEKGGPGSGHWGHAGRPGKRGGSLPGDVAVSIRTGRTARERQAAAVANAQMLKSLNENGDWSTKNDPDFKSVWISCRGVGDFWDDVTPDQFDPVEEWERIKGAKRYAEKFIRENGDLVEAIDRHGWLVRENPDREIGCNILFTTDQKDAGMGSAGTGSIRVFYAPYDAPKDHWKRPPYWTEEQGIGWGIDPIYVTMHELHHAYGSGTEFDLLSDVLAVGYHLETGNNLNPWQVKYTTQSWFYSATTRASGDMKDFVLGRRKAFKWLYKTHPDYANSILDQWSNADELRRKVKRW